MQSSMTLHYWQLLKLKAHIATATNPTRGFSNTAAVPIAVAASTNDITVMDRRGYLSDNHSAVIEPVNDPAAENPRTVT